VFGGGICYHASEIMLNIYSAHLGVQTRNTILAPQIRRAMLSTLAGELIGVWLAGMLGMDYRLFAFVAVFGWLPIVVVAFQRPDSPTGFDRVMMFAGFPVLFLALLIVSSLWLGS
jgi:hypothetical protein